MISSEVRDLGARPRAYGSADLLDRDFTQPGTWQTRQTRETRLGSNKLRGPVALEIVTRSHFPFYGDVANLDADDDEIPCEGLPGAR
jgi:hypothetical protein